MQRKRLGERTVVFAHAPIAYAAGSIVGELESQGPIGNAFDLVLNDDRWGETSWEKAECKLFEHSARIALEKAGMEHTQLQCLMGGDLLNQLITANYAARQLGVPFLGLYGACSTMAEALLIGSMLIDGGFMENVGCTASSHFATAERQFRYPLEMGTTSPPTAQRTVTGAGTVLLLAHDAAPLAQGGEVFEHVCITSGTLGKVVDMGISDMSNMGAAMAPAAADTIVAHLRDTGRSASEYDAIVTGDLGSFGSEMLLDLCKEEGISLQGLHQDCGTIVFSKDQNLNCGGSGCGCSAVVLSAHLLPLLERGVYKRMLFLATGALMSSESYMQGESIPGIAHAVVLEHRGE